MTALRARIVFTSALVVLVALLTLLGLDLNATHDKARRQVEQRYRSRAAVTASLTQSVFAASVQAANPAILARFGVAHVRSPALAPRASETLTYRVLVGPDGRVIAASPGTPKRALLDIAAGSPHIRAALAGQTFALSRLLRDGRRRPVFEFAAPFTTRFGRRVMVTAFVPQMTSGFIAAYLAQAGPPGSSAYVLDAHGAIVASANPNDQPGTVLSDSALRAALGARPDGGSLTGGRYFTSAPVGDSDWRVVLTSSDAALFATVNDGNWVPWMLLVAFAVAGALALVLLWRVMRDAGHARANSRRLELANIELERRLNERKRAEQRLHESEERFRLLVDGVQDYAILMLDSEARVVSWNTGAERLYGYSQSEILGTHASVFAPPQDVAAGKIAAELATVKRDGRFEDEAWRVRKDGSCFWASVALTALRNGDGTLRGYAKVIRDATERKLAEEKLVHDAMHDALTGLPNRALFLDRLTHALARCARGAGNRCAVLFLDVDRFKLLNDSYSHLVGDELLVQLARRLDSSLRPGDTVARLGGDEFTVLLDDLTDDQSPAEVTLRIQALLEKPFEVNGRAIRLSASIGISQSAPGLTAADMMRNADIAMYEAKRAGRSRVATFNDEMYGHVVGQLRVETELRDAIEDRRLRVFYQPIIDLRDGRLSGFEALARWPADAEPMPADRFVAVAEDTGLIGALGKLVLDEACFRFSEWRLAGLIDPSVTMSVNVSGRQLVDDGLIAQVEAALERSGLPPESLVVELTESTIINDPDRMHRALGQLRRIGVKAQIDDFGTGYSSLTFLHHFPGRTLKVDRSFIASMHTDASHEAIVRGIVTLAHSIDFEVIAEGVDDPAQLASLRRLGCEQAQGFLFAEPLPAEQVADFVAGWWPELALAAG